MMDFQRQGKIVGFTLIELLVVIVLIVILSAVFIARSPGVSPHLSAITAQIASDVRSIQSLAQSRGKGFYIRFLSGSYQLRDASDATTPGFDDVTLPSGFTLSVSALSDNLVAFDGKGIPYANSALTSALSSDATITVSANNQSMKVTVNSLTGRAHVSI